MSTHALRGAGWTGAALACALLLILTVPSAHAATGCTMYASPSGADTASGTEAAPFRSAQKLVNSLSAGGVGCLRAGTYLQGTLTFPRAGAAGAPITLTSYPGERAKLAGGIVYVRNGSDYVTLSNLDIDGSAAPSQISIQVMAAETVLEGSDITNRSLGRSCVSLGSLAGYGAAVRTVIRGNRFHQCGNPANGNHDHAMYVENSDGARVVDNLIWDSAAWAIHFYPYARHSLVAHNVMDGNGGGVIFAGEGAGGEYSQSYGSSDNTVEYNVITNSTQTYNVESWWGGPAGTGNVARSNCVWNGRQGNISTSDGGFASSSNLTADPKYVSRSTGDFRLASDSPCLQLVGYDTAAQLAGGSPSSVPASDATPPSVAWITPGSGALVSGVLSASTSSCSTSASDNVGVAKVAFSVDGSAVNTDTTAPFGCEWDSRGASDGTHTLKATASDPSGNSSAASTQVTFWNAGTVNTAPSVSIVSPGDGSTVGRSFSVSASATDDAGVAKVEFYVDGSLTTTDTSAPYNTAVSVRKRQLDRWHALSVKAYDGAGLVSSASAQVYVASSVTTAAARVHRCACRSVATRNAHHTRFAHLRRSCLTLAKRVRQASYRNCVRRARTTTRRHHARR